jgi:tetratricopeptide (TPR) repeat protein
MRQYFELSDQATRRRSRALRAASAGVLALAAIGAAHAQAAPSNCGNLSNAYGPFDYRTEIDRRAMVEPHHFDPGVEALVRGKNSYLGGDIDYTLRAFPNHHRALLSMMRYGERLKVDQVPAARYSVECYFIRGVTFKPDDTVVRMLYAMYLNSRNRKDEALQQLGVARSYAGDNALTHYNLGMLYMDLAQPDEARELALRALELGYPKTDLKDRLVAANKWVDPASAPR